MLRSQWKFTFDATDLAKAAAKKKTHHEERLKFWATAREKVMAEVRDTGIEVSESEAGQNYTNSYRGPQVMVRTDLQTRLTECHGKIQEHNKKIIEYAGWVQILEGNPKSQLPLDADDYLFFFGGTS